MCPLPPPPPPRNYRSSRAPAVDGQRWHSSGMHATYSEDYNTSHAKDFREQTRPRGVSSDNGLPLQ